MNKASVNTSDNDLSVIKIFERLRNHNFHPLNDENSMTMDRNLKLAGIADFQNDDWKIRLLAVRDLVRAGNTGVNEIIKGLSDPSIHVRQASAMALGILRADQAVNELEKLVRYDDNAMVRSQAVIALGQMESEQSLDLLREKLEEDPSRDVQHQCELSIYQIENKKGATEKLLSAYLSLDESTFKTVKKGSVAHDFVLEDTERNEWQLSTFRDKNWVVLIWVFANWCPVCHGEFRDLIEMQKDFNDAGIKVFTLEIHDTFRARVMTGRELDPKYWFAKESFQDLYTKRIWWPHLPDRAGIIAAMYGADPLAFSVHAEYINRPTTVIIDNKGVVQFSYVGTYWGDRPSIEQTFNMIKTGDFSFEHPQRRK